MLAYPICILLVLDVAASSQGVPNHNATTLTRYTLGELPWYTLLMKGTCLKELPHTIERA